MPQILRSLVINQSQKLSIFFWKPNKYEWLFHSDAVHFPPPNTDFSYKIYWEAGGGQCWWQSWWQCWSCVPGDHLYKIYWLVSPLQPLRGGGHTEDTCYSGHKWGHVTRDTWRHHPGDTEPVTMQIWPLTVQCCATRRTWVLRIGDLNHESRPH